MNNDQFLNVLAVLLHYASHLSNLSAEDVTDPIVRNPNPFSSAHHFSLFPGGAFEDFPPHFFFFFSHDSQCRCWDAKKGAKVRGRGRGCCLMLIAEYGPQFHPLSVPNNAALVGAGDKEGGRHGEQQKKAYWREHPCRRRRKALSCASLSLFFEVALRSH